MRAKKIILAAMAICGSFCALVCRAESQGAANLAKDLLHTPQYICDATFEVLLPQAMDPVVYDVTLQSTYAIDSLAPCDYLIRWATTTSAAPVDGFSAYFSGNHYRYRNNRLQEYHMEANSGPFLPLGPGSEKTGVQYTAQFADLLPQFIGAKILEMAADTSYIYKYHPDTIVAGKKSIVIDGVKRGAGYDQMVYTYVFDYESHMPKYIEIESSPGSISEQIMTVNYNSGTEHNIVDLSEGGLIDEYPEVFERFRESTFRAENLVGTSLPAFACQILDSGAERYTHHNDEGFASPMVIVILDPSVATTKEVINSIREAIASAPMDIDILWAFNSNNASEIRETVGTLGHGETALTSANSLIRNCGVTLYPTTIIVDKSSKIHDVIAGANKDLGLIVLQKAMLLK